MNRGKFVLIRTDAGWHFNLVAANGECIMTSEVYESRQAAEKGYRAVVQNAPTATVEEPED